jgi:hypothetical protein
MVAIMYDNTIRLRIQWQVVEPLLPPSGPGDGRGWMTVG